MKKFFKSLILILIVAMAFAAAPALAEGTAPDTYNNVFQGEYEGSDQNTGAQLSGFASIVYGHLNGEATEFGIELNYYGTSVWEEVVATRLVAAKGANANGDFGLALFSLKDGYYSVRAYADGQYGEYVYFTVGDSYKANYTIEYYFEDENGDFVLDSSKTETLSGSVGGVVTAEAKVFEGYEYDSTQGEGSGTITADGQLKLTLFYAISKVDVTYNLNGGTIEGAVDGVYTESVKAGTTITAKPTKANHVFMGWTDAEGNAVTEISAETTTLNATWYDLSVLEMGKDVAGELFLLQGGGKGHYPAITPNNYGNPEKNEYTDNNWTEDGYYAGFATWNCPGHADYVGSVIAMPNLDMSKLESITIRYLGVADNFTYVVKDVYLRANATVTTNTTDGAIKLSSKAAKEAVTVTLTKEQLLAVMPADDNSVLHTLYIDGTGWTACRFMIDSIRIQSTDEEIVAYNQNFTTVTREYYLQSAEGGYAIDASKTVTGTVLKGDVSYDIPAIAGYEFDADNVDNVTSATVTGATTFKYYYNLSKSDITYHNNDGTDAKQVVAQFGTDALIAGLTTTRDGYVFAGWATKADAALADIDADGIVGSDTEFYAVWYELSWLEFSNANVNASLISGYGISSDFTVDDTASTDKLGVQVGVNQNPAASSGKTSAIKLPHVDISKLLSIEIRYKNGDENNDWPAIVSINNLHKTNDEVNGIKYTVTTEWTTLTITASQIREKFAGVEYIDELTFSGIHWADRRVHIDYIRIYSTEYGYPTPPINVTYNFNNGQDTSGNTTVTVDAEAGDKLMDGSTLVREGYTFYGWATKAELTTYDEMLAASELADNGIIEASATYYAIWYGNDWLEFNDSTVKPLIVNGSYTSAYTGTPVDTELNMAGGRLQDSFKSRANHFQILLPRVAIADIASIECKAYAYSFTWDAPYVASFASTSSRWFGVAINGLFTSAEGSTENGGDNTNAFWAAASAGVFSASADAAKVATLMQSEHVTAGTTYLKFLDMASSQSGDQMLLFDYIRITKNA